MKIYRFLRALSTLVIYLGLWILLVGLMGSLTGFTQEMSRLYHSSRNSLGLDNAVVVNPAERQAARVVEEISTEAPDSMLFLPLLEDGVTATPFLPVTGALDGQETPAPEISAAEALATDQAEANRHGALPPTETPTPTKTPKPIGAPDRIVINKINLDAQVVIIPQLDLYLGENVFAHWQAPDFYAAGWHAGSAFLGEPGNTVMSGHNAIHGGVFDNLAGLQQGDEIVMYAGGVSYRYLVSQVMLFEEKYASLEQRLDNARWIMPSEDERITLVSCWPPRSNSQRIIVVGTPIE